MASFLVVIHEQRFILSDARVQQLRSDVVDAVRAGGDLVDFRHEEGEAGVLVSAATQLVIRRIPEVEPGQRLAEEASAEGGMASVVPLRGSP